MTTPRAAAQQCIDEANQAQALEFVAELGEQGQDFDGFAVYPVIIAPESDFFVAMGYPFFVLVDKTTGLAHLDNDPDILYVQN